MNLPLAVIIDIDETILSSSGFNAALIKRGIGFDGELLKQWISSANGSPIPGASEFLNYAHSKGIAVFYITGRDVSQEAATREVLRAGGFPLRDDVDVVLTKNEREGWTRDKASRRRHIAESYRVLLVVGDDLNDFVSGAYTSLRERSSVVEMYDDYWGRKWIILPNPVYGSWEGATYGFGYDLPDREKLRRKYEILSPIRKYFLRRNASRPRAARPSRHRPAAGGRGVERRRAAPDLSAFTELVHAAPSVFLSWGGSQTGRPDSWPNFRHQLPV